MTSAEVDVEPRLLVWARETSGLRPEEVTRKLKIDSARLASWERGDSRPTVSKLESLAEAYHRPLSVFLLRDPPEEPPPPKDFRTGIAKGHDSAFSADTLLAIRRARRVQKLAEELEPEAPRALLALSKVDLAADPETAAVGLARALGLPSDSPPGYGDQWEAFSLRRAALERAGVLVLQFKMPIDDARGFSLPDPIHPVVVANRRDTPRPRSFTLMHELVHLLRDGGGVCDIRSPGIEKRPQPQIEVYCNAVAGAMLVPRNPFVSDLAALPPDEVPDVDEVKGLATRYQVSESVLIRRLLTVGRISASEYAEADRELRSRGLPTPKRTGRPAQNIPRERIAQFGPRFVHAALQAAEDGRIGTAALAEILDLKVKHIPKLAAQAARIDAGVI